MLELPGMDTLCAGLVSQSYAQQGLREITARNRLAKDLYSQRKLPGHGWDEMDIERFFADLALMDSSNFKRAAGVGEREARVACPLVARRNMRLAHGIGRSGDIAAEQPKAAGSTLLARTCHFLVRDALILAGLPETGIVQVLPLATGMTITMTLLSCQTERLKTLPGCKYVLWSRIDQKTCLKAIVSANLVPVVIEPVLCGDELQTDTAAITAKLAELGPENVTCIVTTTSCFAPRSCDDVEGVARLCAAADVPHIINNAYGVQSADICRRVTRACRVGRVDAIIQSTDKNFMVPVGGAVLAAPKGRPLLVDAVSKAYPGRASASAHIDLAMTLLHWGRGGWLRVLAEREELFVYLQEQVQQVTESHGERLLLTPGNPISIGITLATLTAGKSSPHHPASSSQCPEASPAGQESASAALSEATQPSSSTAADVLAAARSAQSASGSAHHAEQADAHAADAPDSAPHPSAAPVPASVDGCRASEANAAAGQAEGIALGELALGELAGQAPVTSAAGAHLPQTVTFLGSMLWQRCVSGMRVIARGKEQTVAGIPFIGYGSSCNAYPYDYCTAAAAVGTSKEDVDLLVRRLNTCLTEFKKRA